MAFDGFERNAPKGKFRVVGVDTFSHEDWLEGDFDTADAALAHAKRHGGVMNKMHVYNDVGKHIGYAGTF